MAGGTVGLRDRIPMAAPAIRGRRTSDHDQAATTATGRSADERIAESLYWIGASPSGAEDNQPE